MKYIIHKADYKNKTEIPIGFGQYRNFPGVVCDKKYPWNRRMYRTTRNWKDVTCLKCLSKKR